MANWYLNHLTVFGGKKYRDRFNKNINTLFNQGPFREYCRVSQGRGFSYYEYESKNGSNYDLLEVLFKDYPQLRFQLAYSECCNCIQALIIIQGGEILDYRRGPMYDKDYNPIDIGLPDGWKTINTPIAQKVGSTIIDDFPF